MKQSLIAFCLVFITNAFSQSNNINQCGTTELMESYYKSNPKSKIAQDNFELFTSEFIKQRGISKSTSSACYVIPVVFHVYGAIQGGKLVNDTVIQRAMNLLNKDFHGLNSDFNSVHTNFAGIRASMADITFALAQLDPNGNPTSGIEYYPTTSGYASSTNWPLIAAEAWDNYKYMNIFVQHDLTGQGSYSWVGFSTFPDTAKSNKKLTMIGFNGTYLGYNQSEGAASNLTHEVGHWLNLYHTFQGGCTIPGDYVSDTPECDYLGSSYGCHTSPTATLPINCNNVLINAENYMDYAGFLSCYKMFTLGQANRAYSALYHPSRQPLWQPSNLIATGLSNLCPSITGLINFDDLSENVILYPNPSKGSFEIQMNNELTDKEFVLMNSLGQIVYKQVIYKGSNTVSTKGIANGLYHFFVYKNNQVTAKGKLIIE